MVNIVIKIKKVVSLCRKKATLAYAIRTIYDFFCKKK